MSILNDMKEEAAAQEDGVDLDSAFTADLLRRAGGEIKRLKKHIVLLEANLGSAMAVELLRQQATKPNEPTET